MGTLEVRVTPGSSRPGLELNPGGVNIRVRSVPEAGKATEEARKALAKALGVPPSAVSLHAGRRSRSKVFSVDGLSSEQIVARLGAG